MKLVRRASCLWPGLPQLWQQGSWGALAAATTFGAAVGAAIVATFVWPDWQPSWIRWGLWLASLAAAGVAAVAHARQWWGATLTESQADNEERFAAAIDAYLKGNLVEAENYFRALLRENAADCDARMHLATLLRHSGRLDEAREMLWRLERFESSAKWEPEIVVEHQRLTAIAQAVDGPSGVPTEGATDEFDASDHAAHDAAA